MLRNNKRDPDKLNRLFIEITDDLSYARTFYPNRSVRVFLNILAQRVFHNIYKGKRFPVERLRLFWTETLPKTMWETRRALLLSFSVFALAFTIGVLSSIINPEFARVILGDGYVDMTIENIEKGDPMAVYKESAPLGMTVGIAANNLFVAFRTAIFGVIASIGTLLIMLYNGIMIGAFQYFFIQKGLFWESFLTVWIHGTLEISAIIIAGAAGLVAGSGLLFPGTYRRVQAFQISMRQGLVIFLGIVPIIVLAAIFEGFLTRYTETPDFIRGLFIATSLFFVIWYFVWLPWHKARTGAFSKAEQGSELPPDKTEPLGFSQIKTSGEIFGDAVTMMRRNARRIFLNCLIGVGVFIGYVMLFASESLTELFPFRRSMWGVWYGMIDFFGNEKVPYLYYLQLLLLVFVFISAFRVIEREVLKSVRPADTVELEENTMGRVRNLLIRIPYMAVVGPAVLLVFNVHDPGLLWLYAMFAFPFLALWQAVIWFERTSPVYAFLRAFKMIRWGTSFVLGLLMINLTLLVFLFLDTPIWEMALELFRWLVPPEEGALRTFMVVTTATVAAFLLYCFFAFLAFCGVFQLFSYREISDAGNLHAGIEQVGKARQIRGLARE